MALPNIIQSKLDEKGIKYELFESTYYLISINSLKPFFIKLQKIWKRESSKERIVRSTTLGKYR